MSIDIRKSSIFAACKSQSTEDDIGKRQRTLNNRRELEAEELKRRLQITTSIYEKQIRFLKKRLEMAEQVLIQHGLPLCQY